MKCSNRCAGIRHTTGFCKLKWSHKRIQYYANYFCVFNLILNCGDVERNSGPPAPEPTSDEKNFTSNLVQTLCPSCSQNVNLIAGLFCDSCKFWWHVTCLSFSRDQFIQSVLSYTGWVCPKCLLPQNKELDVTTDKSFQATVHGMSSNCEVSTFTNVPPGDDNVGGFNLPKKTKGLIIGHLKIRSIKAGTKLDELKAILLQKPTVRKISFSETWLDDSWTDDMLVIQNYSFARCDRSSNIRGGGIIAYIHKDVPYSPRHDLATQTVESTCIEIKLPFNFKNTIPTYVRDDDDELLTDPTEIANAFNSYFAQVMGTIKGVVHNDLDFDALQQFVADRLPTGCQFTIPPVSEDYLLKEIQELSCAKAKGIDSLNVRLLQVGRYELVSPLLYIYNSSIKSGVFPRQWKTSKITPIFKKGSRQGKHNYRRISVLSVLSKILERHCGQHLLNFLLEYHLLSESQFGSRPLHSCESLLLKLTDTWLDTMDKGDLIGLLLTIFVKFPSCEPPTTN